MIKWCKLRVVEYRKLPKGVLPQVHQRKTELKLTNVARASLEELRLDYEDFLRQRGLDQWVRADPRRARLITLWPRSAGEVAAWAPAGAKRVLWTEWTGWTGWTNWT